MKNLSIGLFVVAILLLFIRLTNGHRDDVVSTQQRLGITMRPVTNTPVNIDTSSYMCDKVIKYPTYSICYDYSLRAATAVWYTLSYKDVNRVNIKKRPSFHVEQQVPSSSRARPKDYSHSGFDRGHMAPDASFDYNMEVLNTVYSMANIVPQYPAVNRHQWIKAERYERLIATVASSVKVINIIKYPKHPQRIGKHKIAVPNRFYKVLLFSDEIRVFSYENEKKAKHGDKLKDHLIYSHKE